MTHLNIFLLCIHPLITNMHAHRPSVGEPTGTSASHAVIADRDKLEPGGQVRTVHLVGHCGIRENHLHFNTYINANENPTQGAGRSPAPRNTARTGWATLRVVAAWMSCCLAAREARGARASRRLLYIDSPRPCVRSVHARYACAHATRHIPSPRRAGAPAYSSARLTLAACANFISPASIHRAAARSG